MVHEILQFVPREVWDREYSSVKAIPSSTREEPAKALVLFADLMALSASKRVLDAGCGNGRNAVYLAKKGCIVTAVDFSPEAIKETKRRAVLAGVQKQITTIEHFIDDPLPSPGEAFDVILDCYTFCHFLDEEVGEAFWKELTRVLRPGGEVLSIVFAPDDEYYAQFLSSQNEERMVVTDPSNGISKRLYTEHQIQRYFSPSLRHRFFARFEFWDTVHGKSFKRVVLVSVLQKPVPR